MKGPLEGTRASLQEGTARRYLVSAVNERASSANRESSADSLKKSFVWGSGRSGRLKPKKPAAAEPQAANPQAWDSVIEAEIFASLDADHSGSVSREEFAAWLAPHGMLVSDAAMKEIYNEIDRSKDHSISREELGTYVREMQTWSGMELRMRTLRSIARDVTVYFLLLEMTSHVVNLVGVCLLISGSIDAGMLELLDRIRTVLAVFGAMGFVQLATLPISNRLDAQQRGTFTVVSKTRDISESVDMHAITKTLGKEAALEASTAQVFGLADVDYSGFLNKSELRGLLLSANVVLPESVLRDLFNDIDTSRDGKIEQSELVNYLTAHLTPSATRSRNVMLRHSLRSLAVWAMFVQLMANTLELLQVWLDTSPSVLHVSWAMMLFFGVGLYLITFQQHASDVGELEATRMALMRLALETAAEDYMLLRTSCRSSDDPVEVTSAAVPWWRLCVRKRPRRIADSDYRARMKISKTKEKLRVGASLLHRRWDESGEGLLSTTELMDGLKRSGFLISDTVLHQLVDELVAQPDSNHVTILEPKPAPTTPESSPGSRCPPKRVAGRGGKRISVAGARRRRSSVTAFRDAVQDIGAEVGFGDRRVREVSAAQWGLYVSKLAPISVSQELRATMAHAVRDPTLYLVSCTNCAFIILLIFFVWPWSSLEARTGVYGGGGELERYPAILQLLGALGSLMLYYKGMRQATTSLETSRISLRNMFWALARHTRRQHNKWRSSVMVQRYWRGWATRRGKHSFASAAADALKTIE